MTNNIGRVFKWRRTELNISQSCISRGICSNATLSRFESGESIPSEQIMTQLLERLGYSKRSFDEICSESDYETAKTIAAARRLYIMGRYEEAWPYMDRLLKNYDGLSPSSRRFSNTLGTLMLLRKKMIDDSQALNNFEKLLKETYPDYSITSLPKLMTYNEITLLIFISKQYNSLGRTDTAIRILYHLKSFHEKCIIDEVESMRTLPTILFYLSKLLGHIGKYDECIEICKCSINKLVFSGRSHLLSETMYNLVWALVKRSGEGDLESAKEILIKAYFTAKALKNDSLVGRIEVFIKNDFENIALLAGQDIGNC